MDPTNKTSSCVSSDFPMRRTRHIRFVELWRMREWMLKIYLHSAHGEELPHGYLVKAKTFIEPHLSEAERVEPLHRVGFIILAHGAVSNWGDVRLVVIHSSLSTNLSGRGNPA